jgi:tRNA(Ile)-lysidine synthase
MSKITDILTFWFPNLHDYQEFWFDGSQDFEIYERFGQLLIDSRINLIEKLSNEERLSYIILYDQIARNVKRITNHNQKEYDEIALSISTYIINSNLDTEYPFIQRMFILLPLRHSRTTEKLDLVKSKLEQYEHQENMKENKLYQRFWLATLKDYSKVTDTINIYDSINKPIRIKRMFIFEKVMKFIKLIIMYICSILNINFLNREIINKHPAYDKNIHDEICASYKFTNDFTINLLYQSVEKFIKYHKIRNIGISLSGGVDSNVLMYILWQLKNRGKIDTLVAIHVDYGNRNISMTETDYLIDVCQYMNIPIIVRRITHIQRSNDTAILQTREFYEAETKAIRFGLYKYAMEKYNIQGVCLGHHKDDVTENIFMNIFRGKDLLELYGMIPYNNIDGVNILRPMLDHHKNDIYEISKQCGIMYFNDITPLWSFRGFMRQQLFPMIQNFDMNMLNNLNNIGEKSKQWKEVVEKVAIYPTLKKLVKGRLGFYIELENDYKNLPMAYWSKLFVNIFHSNGIKMITIKNLNYFVKWYDTMNNQLCKLSNGLFVTKYKNKLYFFDETIMITKKTNYDINLITLTAPLLIEKSEPWNILIEPTTEYLKTSMTFDDLINGTYSYSEAIHPTNTFIVKYRLDDKDRTKKIFKGLRQFINVIPKVTSGSSDFDPIGFVKVTITYQKKIDNKIVNL